MSHLLQLRCLKCNCTPLQDSWRCKTESWRFGIATWYFRFFAESLFLYISNSLFYMLCHTNLQDLNDYDRIIKDLKSSLKLLFECWTELYLLFSKNVENGVSLDCQRDYMLCMRFVIWGSKVFSRVNFLSSLLDRIEIKVCDKIHKVTIGKSLRARHKVRK